MHFRIVLFISNLQGLFLQQLRSFDKANELYNQYQCMSILGISILAWNCPIPFKYDTIIPDTVMWNVESVASL